MVEERNKSAAFGTGTTPPTLDVARSARIEAWLLTQASRRSTRIRSMPPRRRAAAHSTRNTAPAATARPAATSPAKASARSRRSPRSAPTAAGSTRTRYDLAVNQSTLYAGYPWRFAAFPQDVRLRQHAARRLVAARAVPAQRLGADRARPARARVEAPAVFYRGYDVYDPVKLGFVSRRRGGRRPAILQVRHERPGNANIGTRGRALRHRARPTADKDALVEFLKTSRRRAMDTHSSIGLAPRHDSALVRRGPRRRRARLAFYGWYKFFREEPQEPMDDGDAGDALPLRLDRRRERCRHPVLDLLRAAADVSREAPRDRAATRRWACRGSRARSCRSASPRRPSASRGWRTTAPPATRRTTAQARTRTRCSSTPGPGTRSISRRSSASWSTAPRIRASTPTT